MLSFYLVALGVAYPIGSLIQGPVVDRIGIGWTTTGTALLVTLVLAGAALLAPAARRALFRPAAADNRGGAADHIDTDGQLSADVQLDASAAAPAGAAAVAALED